ncbi:uncharacterized protein LOC131150517 [Malania oleifera]|uniref:uncharacterized protein LOC131150517 n=1 Tax=Malania oleifera TaxID=397392 RepID=UPI0025AE14D3|nr:uncharacterized protein LOC131150517 [Malania oleifera]
MVDDFMVCVDRIIASACFESINGGNEERRNLSVNSGGAGNSEKNSGGEGCSKKGEVVECRICQEEDEENAMEAPCACSGTLKFAHRKCIQKWCNKKGGLTCEICNQVYSPNYSLPPASSNPDVMAIDIRQAWGPHIDLRDPHLLALAAAERQLLQSDYEDYATANSGSIACLRSIALILLLILLVRQALMLTRDSGIVLESSTFFNFQMSILQFAGFLLPCYVMARSWYIIQGRRRRQG